MARPTSAVYSFGAGVMAPSMEMRADAERYFRASRQMENMVVTPQGGATMRHGSQYIGEPKDKTQPFRLFTDHRGGDASDILVELSAGTTRWWRDDALLMSGGSPVEVPNPYLQSELADVTGGDEAELEVFVQGNHPPEYVRFTTEDDVTSQPIFFSEVPRQRFTDKKSTAEVDSLSDYTVEFNGTWVDGDRFVFSYDGRVNTTNLIGEPTEIRYLYSSTAGDMLITLQRCLDESQVLGQAATSVVAGSGPDTFIMTINGAAAGRGMAMDLDPPNGVGNRTVAIALGVDELNIGLEPSWSYPFVVLNVGNYWQCILVNQADATPTTGNEPGVVGNQSDTYWLDLGTTKPDWFDYQWPDGNPWVTGSFYGPWDRGWPRTVTFHQQRLYFASTKDVPTGLWASRIGFYTDFQIGVNDSDPFLYTLATVGSPAIQWMRSLQGLVLGTTNGVYRISADVVISPTDILVERQNAARSARISPRPIGNALMYVQLGNRKVESAEYARDQLALVSSDVSTYAENLFESRIIALEEMLIPESLLLGIREDGKAVCLSVVPEQQIAAWYEWNTQGSFSDVSSVFDLTSNETQFYFSVLRNGEYLIEKIIYPPRDFPSQSNWQGKVYLDSYQEGTITDSDTITGIDPRFEGQTVGVTVNDAWEGEHVVTGGEVTLSGVRTGYWSVGFRYLGYIESFEHASGNPAGVAFGTARRWNKLSARLVNSALPKINGQRPPDRSPSSPMDSPEPLKTEDVQVNNLGFNDGTITMEQDLPMPTHVVGYYGQIGVHDA